jgi:tetratricopeptide (TPR) repeat protein
VAIDRAELARTIEPWAASPYVQLGLLAEEEGDYPGAAGRLTQAIEREDRNWLYYYLRARIESEGGDLAAARADLREARRLNPEEECLQRGFKGCG